MGTTTVLLSQRQWALQARKAAALTALPKPRPHPCTLCPERRQPRPRRCPALAFLALDAFLAPPPALLQPPHEVMLIFTSVSPLPAAPQCLIYLSNEDLLQLAAPAPELVGGGHPEMQASAAAVRRLGGSLHGMLAARDSRRADAAACLASPILLEENAAEIMRDIAEEQAIGQQLHLKLRYESELHAADQGSSSSSSSSRSSSTPEPENQGKGKGKRWGTSGDRLPLPFLEAQHVEQELQELQGDRNMLLAEELPTRPRSPQEESICLASLEEPDHSLLMSCCVVASVDEAGGA